jgi:hypothetical protein
MPESQPLRSSSDEEITRSQDDPTRFQPGADQIPLTPDRDPGDDPTAAQDPVTEFQDPEPTPSVMSIEEWLNKLRSSDRAFYNIMAMEVWSLAKSMDSMVPGFWSQFMVNRRNAMQEFVDRRRPEGDDRRSVVDHRAEPPPPP